MDMKRAVLYVTVFTLLAVLTFSSLLLSNAGNPLASEKVTGYRFTEKIAEVQRRLQEMVDGNQQPTPEHLKQIQLLLQEAVSGNITESGSSPSVVCPEHYAGPKHVPTWVTENCTSGRPTPELVTIILYDFQFKNVPPETLRKKLSAIGVQFPGVTVITPVTSNGTATENMKYVRFSAESTPGQIWNKLISVVTTPYAFLATNVNFSMDSASMQRLLRVVTETSGVSVAGTATRNATGFWKAGCYQTHLKNYVLRYQKGYHQSHSECMLCDHVDSPFLAETRMLKAVQMAEGLPAQMLFPDFFLRIHRSNRSLLCPDVMLATNEGFTPEMPKKVWRSLARKWQLNRIQVIFPRGSFLHKFNCTEAEVKCESLRNSFTLPVCCQEEFARAIKFWAKFANENGIHYQFLSGSVLGAVKVEDLMPWDLDGDLQFDKANYSFVKSSAEAFQKQGIQLGGFKEPTSGDKWTHWGYMKMTISGLYVEMVAVPLHLKGSHAEQIFPDAEAPPGENPYNTTRVEIHGVWVNSPPNPGRYVRERYGKNILKHSLSWIYSRKESSWDPYDNVGEFKKDCGSSGHHACLNSMPTDGSIYYNVPE